MVQEKELTPVPDPKPKPKKRSKSKKMVRMSSKPLVVVESPTKARTLERYLAGRYKVIASQGHVMDLPASQFGVDVENGFAPKYIVIFRKRRIVKELKLEAARHKTLYVATDPDREGEAISAHLATVLGEGKEVHRAVFHEITPEAIKAAFDHPIEVDRRKVEAQQARRILDRILGYSLSPLLWKKVGRGLSAGRVQSVALKLIVDREAEVQAFRPVEYWEVTAQLAKLKPGPKEPAEFTASLVQVDGKKADLKNQQDAEQLVEGLKEAPFVVQKVTRREQRRHPSAPFTTSTLQQDAFNRLGFGAARTMRIAQQLYEGIDLGEAGPVGLITYMRTDSVQIAAGARGQARAYIESAYGKEYLPEKPPIYKSRGRAQEAHEAIRPTGVERTPDQMKSYLTPEQLKLYRLIWSRFLASQMAPAKVEQTSADIQAGRCGFRASGSRILFPGFLKVLKPQEETDPETPKDKKGKEKEPQFLPKLEETESLRTLSIDPSQHFTKPPARFTEASLIRTMEELGIGRPSTYAPTVQTLITRGYVNREGRALIPAELGGIVIGLLAQHFEKMLDVQFTARMEAELDKVEEGELAWNDCVQHFYEPFADRLAAAKEELESVKQEPVPTGEVCPDCGKPLVIKWGRKGRFISCSGFPDCRFAKPLTTGVPCPENGCDGELVQRRSRRGIFYGCSRFPKCRHISNKLPERADGQAEAPGASD
ncbi:MAG: DNA topoisomerase I [Candidatus Omnitrophica bacterium CG11_big_fil_rev_8_21_14_0_20_64_10]|nr:MAG: DNA topoisomerase I [Candidatus Omnitrophica bacterium CG11_big_fil_rev_8_21_14_0_20_64_10]